MAVRYADLGVKYMCVIVIR